MNGLTFLISGIAIKTDTLSVVIMFCTIKNVLVFDSLTKAEFIVSINTKDGNQYNIMEDSKETAEQTQTSILKEVGEDTKAHENVVL